MGVKFVIETDMSDTTYGEGERFIEFVKEVFDCARDGSLYTVTGDSDGACVLTGRNYEFNRLEKSWKIIDVYDMG